MKFRIVFPDFSGIKKRIDELLNRSQSKVLLESANGLKDKVMDLRPTQYFGGISGLIGILIGFFVVLTIMSSIFSSINLNGTSNVFMNFSYLIIVPLAFISVIFAVFIRFIR